MAHCVRSSFQIFGLRQHEAAEVVARTVEDEFARQPRGLPRPHPLPIHHPFPNVLSPITRHPDPALAPPPAGKCTMPPHPLQRPRWRVAPLWYQVCVQFWMGDNTIVILMGNRRPPTSKQSTRRQALSGWRKSRNSISTGRWWNGLRYQLCWRIVGPSERIQSTPDSTMALRCRCDREYEQIVFGVSCPNSLFALYACS